MSNESFWKTIGKVLCPENKKPPSVWTMMTVLVIAIGIVLWLLGVPWQFNLAFSLILVLLVITGARQSRKYSKIILKPDDKISNDHLRKPLSPWGVFWSNLLLIILMLGLATIRGIGEIYPSWSQWPVLVAWAIMLLIAIIGCVCSYKCSIKEKNMNENPVKPATTPDVQERKRKALKLLLPCMCLFIVGAGFWVLSFSLDVSRTISILMMTVGGLCWGISGALSLRVILTAIQMQQKETSSQKQLQKNQSKIKWLSIAVVLLFTAGMFIASLFIFSSGD